ncbi:twin-arginine translocase TatA/TatE family subunit [candidate division KSB1 bacterium]|nr:twin-arginine translocase TatA/TatE family subunit [candidate division KSB1 bacterium]
MAPTCFIPWQPGPGCTRVCNLRLTLTPGHPVNLGGSELFLVLLVMLLLFGGKRLPELARNLGRGLAEFRRATQSIQRDISSSIDEVARPGTPQQYKPASTETSSPRITPYANPAAEPRPAPEPPRSDS